VTVLHWINKFAIDKVQRLQLLRKKLKLAEGKEEELDVLTLTGGRCNRLASAKESAFHPLIFLRLAVNPEFKRLLVWSMSEQGSS
jgi:hypothetical protein